MKLKPGIDYAAFLKTVQLCSTDVYFETNQGDCLNLKSALSQFVFAACISGDLDGLDSRIRCGDPKDARILSAYLL